MPWRTIYCLGLQPYADINIFCNKDMLFPDVDGDLNTPLDFLWKM